jgi:imidazole glycerol-phosphate synthase subunit HisF
MIRPRLIPVLLLSNNSLVKSIQFKKHSYVGDPLNTIKLFNDLKADELIILDILATKNKTIIDNEIVRRITSETHMPCTIGGGIQEPSQIEKILKAGADRVVIGNAAYNYTFIEQAVKEFGSSTIVVCIDYKKNLVGKNVIYSVNPTTKPNKLSVTDYAKKMENLGVGEIILQSIDRDGVMNGYDLETIQFIDKNVSIPITALGGAGSYNDFKALSKVRKVSGIASGSCFIYSSKLRGVLINYPSEHERSEIFE